MVEAALLQSNGPGDLLRRRAGLYVEDALFQGGHPDVEICLSCVHRVHTGEVSAGEGLEATKDFALHIPHRLGELAGDALFGGCQGGCQIGACEWGVILWRHRGVASPSSEYLRSEGLGGPRGWFRKFSPSAAIGKTAAVAFELDSQPPWSTGLRLLRRPRHPPDPERASGLLEG